MLSPDTSAVLAQMVDNHSDWNLGARVVDPGCTVGGCANAPAIFNPADLRVSMRGDRVCRNMALALLDIRKGRPLGDPLWDIKDAARGPVASPLAARHHGGSWLPWLANGSSFTTPLVRAKPVSLRSGRTSRATVRAVTPQ